MVKEGFKSETQAESLAERLRKVLGKISTQTALEKARRVESLIDQERQSKTELRSALRDLREALALEGVWVRWTEENEERGGRARGLCSVSWQLLV